MSWLGVAGWLAYGAGLLGLMVCEAPERRRRWRPALAMVATLAPLTALVAVGSAGPGGLLPVVVPLVGLELVLCLLLVTKGDPVGLFLRRTRPDRADAVARRAASRQAATATALFLAVAAVTVLVASR